MACGTQSLPPHHTACGTYTASTQEMACGAPSYRPSEPPHGLIGASFADSPSISCGTGQLPLAGLPSEIPQVTTVETDPALMHTFAKNNTTKKPKQTSKQKGQHKTNPKEPTRSTKTPGPNGLYEDAPYHTTKGNDRKSKRPKDGQKALDNSVPIDDKNNSKRRIGISEGEFVVLAITSSEVYHGHVREWSELDERMQETLKKLNLVSPSGKIIKRTS